MKRKTILLLALLLSSVLHVKADEGTVDGVFVWVNGSSTCYKLSDVPKVTYSDGFAILTLGSSSSPELKVELKDGNSLEITFGTYSGIKDIMSDELSKVEKNGKFIRGGRLIIIKDGKQYDVNGTLIK